MRFWFEHSGDVSLREQVVTQVTLGVLCGELAPGERLPSIRELARRFGLHPNTVSAGYRQLTEEGWVESRRGSGVYVREARPQGPRHSNGVAGFDRLVENLFASAGRMGIAREEVVARVQAASAVRPRSARPVLIEPDDALRCIVLAELGSGIEACAAMPKDVEGSLLLSLPSKVESLRVQAGGRARVLPLRVRAMTGTMTQYLPPNLTARAEVLVGVASAWGDFRRFARTMLIASGFAADALLVRDTADADWRKGLEGAAAVVCDVSTAAALKGTRNVVIGLLAEGVAEEVSPLRQR